MRERLLVRVALRVRVGVGVLLRERLLVDLLEVAARLEVDAVPVVDITREGVLLGAREVDDGLASAVRLAEAGREAEKESEGVDVRLTLGNAEEDDEEEHEEE